ncbi:hypothetical protein M1105_12925, partial [Limibaculum sp. FT325]|uniref:hypothetical protein n=1 Tax=Thermohalobaculum sediminis TaxID=2939436 RepID=UPI0020BFDDB6
VSDGTLSGDGSDTPVVTPANDAPTIAIGMIADDDVLSDAEDGSVSFVGTTSGVENGQVVSLSLRAAGGTELLWSGTATVASGTWSVSGVDLSDLADGADYTLEASVSDAAGNAAVPAERNFTSVDFELTVGVVETSDYGNRFNAALDPDGLVHGAFVIDGAPEDLVLSFDGFDIDYDDELRVFVNDVDLGTVPTGVDEGLAAYTLLLSADLLQTGVNSITFEKLRGVTYKWGVTNLLLEPRSVPPSITIGVIAGDDVLDDTEDGSVSFAGTTSGVEDGQVVSLSLRAAGGTELLWSGTATVASGTWSVSGVDLSGLADGADYTLEASVSDAAGNTAVPAERDFATIGATAPSITIGVIAGDDVLDDTEDGSVSFAGTTSGVEDGKVVSLSLRAVGGTELLWSGTATVASGTWSVSGVDLSGLADGADYTLEASVSDAAVPAERDFATIGATVDFELTIGVIETGDYGNRFNDALDPDGLVYGAFVIDGAPEDLVLSFDGFDIDYDDELRVFVNDVDLGTVPAGVDEGLAAYVLSLSADLLHTGINSITFEKLRGVTYKWGVTNILLEPGSVPPPPPVFNLGLIAKYDTTLWSADDPSGYGSADPSGIAYIPELDMLFIADSEHNESPFFSSINLFAVRTDGTYVGAFSLRGFTDEPTGLGYNPLDGLLYISDDDQAAVFVVDPLDPTTLLRTINLSGLGIGDAEEPVFDPLTGHMYILDGADRTLYELTVAGDLVSSFRLPSVITDAEGLVYDYRDQTFLVSSGLTNGVVFKIDKSGKLLASSDFLNDDINPYSGITPKLKGLDLAPSSDPNDGDTLSLYAVDYGVDQFADGRLYELDIYDDFNFV